MAALVTTCPITGRKIEIGIETDKVSIERTPHFVTRIDCPHCRKEHAFVKSDMLLCEMVDGVIHYLRAA
jgi:hypothetical protein